MISGEMRLKDLIEAAKLIGFLPSHRIIGLNISIRGKRGNILDICKEIKYADLCTNSGYF
jgi:hypothetical protein